MMTSFISDFSDREHSYKAEIKILNEQIKSLLDQLFGKKTEKIHKDDGQRSLFDILEPDTPILDEPEEISVPAHNRKKPGRKPLPENLPRVEVIHDLTEEEKTCACGCMKSRCGKEESEQLDIIPAQMRVIKNIRYKYACKNCEGVEDDGPTVSIARMPEQMIPKSIATPRTSGSYPDSQICRRLALLPAGKTISPDWGGDSQIQYVQLDHESGPDL